MRYFEGLGSVPPGFGPSAVTIGKFDGVHRGHRKVLTALREVASERGLVSTVVTFDRNPLALLAPAAWPLALTSNDQKVELLASTGVDATVMIPFTTEFSEEEPEQFVESVLVTALHAKVVFVGSTFRFGHLGRGDVPLLQRLGAAGGASGFEVISIDEVLAGADRPVSSTLIRELLDRGAVGDAAGLLGRPPSIRATVVHGEHRGRLLGYPTANLSPQVEGFIPADGVYAATLTFEGRSMPAAVSIGNNPTFDGVPDKQVEAHVLDQTIDLYGASVVLEFIEYIRPMNKFPDADALVLQMNADEQRIRGILGVPGR